MTNDESRAVVFHSSFVIHHSALVIFREGVLSMRGSLYRVVVGVLSLALCASSDAARHSQEASQVLAKVMAVPERGIPRDLVEGAEAVAVCAGVLKAAFIVGGRKGDCVISRRTAR